MYRVAIEELYKWKEGKRRKPLIIEGARQVGKTYILLEFGKKHYENVAYFNFETNPNLIKTFDESIEPSYLVPLLSRIAGQTIIREKTPNRCVLSGSERLPASLFPSKEARWQISSAMTGLKPVKPV